jgi:hypothetical protein
VVEEILRNQGIKLERWVMKSQGRGRHTIFYFTFYNKEGKINFLFWYIGRQDLIK